MKQLATYLTGLLPALALAAGFIQPGAANLTVTSMHKSLAINHGGLPLNQGGGIPPNSNTEAPLVMLEQGQLSVRVMDMDAADLLEAIARQGGFVIEQQGSLQRRVSLEFYQLPLWQGLQRILADRSFALRYRRPADAVRQQSVTNPSALWIFDHTGQPGTGGNAPLQDVCAAGQDDDVLIDIASLQDALGSARVEDREAAVAYLGDSGLAVAVGPLSLALIDEDETVRELAIEALAELEGPDVIAALAIALADRDPAVREEAIDALGKIGGAQAIELLEQALADSEEFVRAAASEWLEELVSGDRL